MPARNNIEIVLSAQDKATSVIEGAAGRLQQVGTNLQSMGSSLTLATAPIAAGMGAAVYSAIQFDEAMTNVGAVLGKDHAQMKALNAQVLAIGAASRAGPQKAAEAFYDITGGVADASSHMAILNASIATAEAGNADLGATTSALISVMNSYGYSADQAAFASDVLTKTVGMGVGTMDQFASALPAVAGMAANAGIEFDHLAASSAFMTTKGFTASQSVTRLNAAMTALLTPNKEMQAALEAAGIESGSAGLAMYGLAGTLGRVEIALGGSTDAMAKALGSSEALQAAVVLNGAGFEEFLGTFIDTAAGATEAARSIQLESAAAQFDLLKSKIGGLGIEIGNVLLPALSDIMAKVSPVVQGMIDWIQQNPEVTRTVLMVAGGLVILGPLLYTVGTAIGLLATGIGILLSPAVLLAGAIAAIVAAAQFGYPGGIAQLLTDAANSAQQLAFLGFYVLNLAAQTVRTAIEGLTGKVTATLDALSLLYNKSPEVHDAINKLALVVGIAALAYAGMHAGILMVNTVQTVATGITWALAAAKTALATAAGAASMGVSGLATAFMAALGPILAVAAAVAGVIAAVNNFNQVTAEARTAAGNYVAANSENISEQQLWEQVRRSAVAEHGDNPFADIIARSMFEELKGKMQPKALGGSVSAGSPYLVGEKGPELFVPPSSGDIVPNGSGSGRTYQIMVNVTAATVNDTVNTEANAQNFGHALELELRRMG